MTNLSKHGILTNRIILNHSRLQEHAKHLSFKFPGKFFPALLEVFTFLGDNHLKPFLYKNMPCGALLKQPGCQPHMFDFKDFEVTALGRCAEPPLMEAALVSLWHGGTQECLASATVGRSSRVEGFYAWEPLLEPVVLQKGQEYRLSMHLGRRC